MKNVFLIFLLVSLYFILGVLFLRDLSKHVSKITGLDPEIVSPPRSPRINPNQNHVGKEESAFNYESSSQSEDYGTLPNNINLKDYFTSIGPSHISTLPKKGSSIIDNTFNNLTNCCYTLRP